MKMTNKILITYASDYGSTAEIAQFIQDTLQKETLACDLLPIHKVKLLDGYHGVILGAPLYMFHWHRQAFQFLNKNRQRISAGLPVAVFAGGPFGENKEEDWQEVRKNFEQELAKLAWFTPNAKLLVGGKFDPDKLRLPYSLIPALKQLPATDLRDWDAIREWTLSLLLMFQAKFDRVMP